MKREGNKYVFCSCSENLLFIDRSKVLPKYCRVSVKSPRLLEIDYRWPMEKYRFLYLSM